MSLKCEIREDFLVKNPKKLNTLNPISIYKDGDTNRSSNYS